MDQLPQPAGPFRQQRRPFRMRQLRQWHRIGSAGCLIGLQADPLVAALSVPGAEHGMAHARKHELATLMAVRTAHGFEQRLSPAFAAEMQR